MARTFLAVPACEYLVKDTLTSLKALAAITASSDAAPDWSQQDAVARMAF